LSIAVDSYGRTIKALTSRACEPKLKASVQDARYLGAFPGALMVSLLSSILLVLTDIFDELQAKGK
jgi:hypothetical protein